MEGKIWVALEIKIKSTEGILRRKRPAYFIVHGI